jgi:hypothetical protein
MDGFSNPGTERDYRQWPAERRHQIALRGKECGFCSHCFSLTAHPVFALCLNARSPYYQETVSICFSCSLHRSYAKYTKPRPRRQPMKTDPGPN